MKKAIRKTILSMTMALALVATAIPFTAMAAEPETLRTPEVLMELNGFIERDDEAYYGTSTPHDGIDTIDESFLSDYAFGWDESSWLGKFFHVGKGSAMTISLRPDYTGEKLYAYPTVYALDDDGHIAYTVETSATVEEITLTPMTVFKFDNINPMEGFGGSNGLFEEYSGKIPVEKLIYTIEIVKNLMNEERVGLYSFTVNDDGKATEYDQSKFTFGHGVILEIPVNNANITFEAYQINQNNYMKLRDVAQALTGTNKQFNVTWDSGKQAINLVANQAYVSVGGELSLDASLKQGEAEREEWQKEHPDMTFDVNSNPLPPQTQNVTLNTAKIYLDGKEVSLTAYTINGNNYFKLRDLGELFDFGVSWDGATNTVSIDTSKGYTAG